MALTGRSTRVSSIRERSAGERLRMEHREGVPELWQEQAFSASVNAAGTHRYRVVSVRLGREFRWHHGLSFALSNQIARSGFFIAQVPQVHDNYQFPPQ